MYVRLFVFFYLSNKDDFFIFCFFYFLISSPQSKDIGVQMHEELVKVTNELYTVSYSVPAFFHSVVVSCCLFFFSRHWLVVACQSYNKAAIFSLKPATCEAAALTLHTADMPHQPTAYKDDILSFCWGCVKNKICIPHSLLDVKEKVFLLRAVL